MAMILIVGDKGSGKTLTAVEYAYQESKRGKIVLSNIKLNFPHRRLTQSQIKDVMQQKFLKNCVLLLDEIHTITDSRRSMTKKNIQWSYLYTQSRKRGVDIVATTQREMQVENRFRINCDYFVLCTQIQISPAKFMISERWIHSATGRVKIRFNRHPERSFNHYNTNEIVYYDWDS